jgi:hypothetical protein
LAMAEPTYDENLFKWEQAHADVIERKLNSPLTLKSTLQNAGFAQAEIYFSNSSTLQIRIEGMETAYVKDKRQITRLVKTKLWKPNPEALETARRLTCTLALCGSE